MRLLEDECIDVGVGHQSLCIWCQQKPFKKYSEDSFLHGRMLCSDECLLALREAYPTDESENKFYDAEMKRQTDIQLIVERKVDKMLYDDDNCTK